MPYDGLYGKRIECECGRTHHVQPAEVLFARDALDRLPDLCARHAAGRRCAAVMDLRTRIAAGFDAERALARAGWEVDPVVLSDGYHCESPVCDDVTKLALATRYEVRQADLILAVGSGVVSDLGKWVAFDAGKPLITFATAASMNGYASANVAPTIDGVKSLVRARPPAAVVADPLVLAEAPHELTAAGLGDVLAKSVSSADWRLNHQLFGDYYCPRSVNLIAEIEPLYLDRPEAVRDHDREALGALFDALLLTGVAMTLAETSAPASGGEHLVSHTLDMLAVRDERFHDLHGRQVGVGTILASELYRRVLAVESPDLHAPPAGVDRAFWGPLADVVSEQYAAKSDRLAAAGQRLAEGGTWDDLRGALAEMVRPPERIRDTLAAAGAATGAGDIACDRPRLRAAFRHAHEIRPRFTVLDLAHLLGILPAAAEEIVEQWG